MQKENNFRYSSEIRSILKSKGIMGLYTGFWASAWRDVPGWAVYFAAYEWLKV